MRGKSKKFLALILSLVMVLGMLPMTAAAAPETGEMDESAQTSANVTAVFSYAAQMREENQKDDLSQGPFTWDTEGKKDTWRYFNGLMMDALLMTGDETSRAFAEQFYDDNISDDGSIADYGTGELDAVESARGIFDLLDNVINDDKYEKAIQFVYRELEKQTAYEQCGGNYLHKQEEDGQPTESWSQWNIGLDGLYMAEPFLMECANAIDEGKIRLIGQDGEEVASAAIYEEAYARMAWVASAMLDSETGLYHHGWNVENMEGNGHFWARGIGWYAMAQVDIIEMMPEGEYRSEMIRQLPAFFDAMLQYQDAETGMWYNVVNRDESLTAKNGNRLETSGSAMMAYALMKAYNNGYVTDAKYGEAGLKAFNGIVENKFSGEEGNYSVKDIYQKSGVGTTDDYYCANLYTDDEAKGTGALIMAAALANTTAELLPETEDPDVPETPEQVTDEATGVIVSGTTATGLTVADVSGNETVAAALAEKLETGFTAYDIDLEGYTQGTEAAVTMPAPAGADTVFYVSDDGTTVEEIAGAEFQDETVAFKTTHFSIFAAGQAKAGGEDPAPVPGENTVTGNLQGETRYELDTDGVDDGANYLILNSSTNGSSRYAFRNSNGSSARQEVTVSNGVATISENEEACVWTFNRTGNGWNISNGSQYLRLNNRNIISDSQAELQVTNREEGAYRISYTRSWTSYYLSYRSDVWQSYDRSSNVYLFRQVAMPGASVSFSVIPDSASLQTGAQMNLTPTVLVGGAAATDYEITWTSENDEIATVANGTVTGVSDGTVNITATLTAASGTAMQEDLTIIIPVTVSSKTVTSAVLNGNTTRYTKQNMEPDFGGIVLQVTYEDGTTAEITTANGLQISGYDISRIGTQTARITYLGKDYGAVVVVVEGDPYEGLTPAEDYPEYPDDGAVRINKTAIGQDFNSTGAVKVELDAAGISVKSGVDVVLVVDVSNSMGWTDDWFLTNPNATTDNLKIPNGSAETTTDKLDQAMASAQEFANILLGENQEGSSTNNSLSFVTFAGFDADNTRETGEDLNYIDSVQTVFTNVQDAKAANTAFSNTKFTNYTVDGTHVDFTLQIGNTNGQRFDSGINRGNTNYDYAFAQANEAVDQLKNSYGGAEKYANSGRETIVVFMTDGAPSHYNDNRLNGNADDTKYGTNNIYEAVGAYNGNSSDNAETWLQYISNPNQYAQTLNGNIDSFYAVGFDLNHGGFSKYSWSEEELRPVLENIAGENTVDVELVENGAALEEFYRSLATQIKYAGTNARVTDTIKSDFTLLTTQTTGTAGGTQGTLTSAPVIEVRAYDLWTKADTSDENLIGTRKDGGTALETVTFSDDGQQAFSDKIGNGRENIMTIAPDGSVTIAAQSFTYTKDASGTERFVWNIGNITDQEVALSYYAYLKGSMEGDRDGGVYDTNESAVLEYVDINGDFATQTFPLPKVNWQGAITTIQYYLVNEDGYPVNENGVVIPFANRFVVGQGATRTFNLNDSLTVNGAGYTPAGYEMYNPGARYTVQANSDGTGSLTIDDNKTISGLKEVTTRRFDEDEDNYTATAVAFGVIFRGEPVNKTPLQADQIVIDYGKAVQVDVTANETISDSTTYEVVGFMQYNPDTDTSLTQFADGTKTFNADNGQFTITEDGKVQYQLNRMLSEVERIFVVVKVTPDGEEQQAYRMLNELDVIPATTMYYEDDFANAITYIGTESANWGIYKSSNSSNDNLQNDGTVGQNSPYGYDASYNDDGKYSNGTANHIYVSSTSDGGYDITYAQFTFTGTGFDLISSTDDEAAMIRTEIYQGEAAEGTVFKSQQVANKGASELYQIPVLSCEDMPYGTYTVKVQVYKEYTNEAFPALNRGGHFIFDAVRIYDPIDVTGSTLTGDAATAQGAYMADTEAYEQHLELREAIVSREDYDSTTEGTEGDGAVYIDASPDLPTTAMEEAQVADYEMAGPNNETYLKNKSCSIGFILNVDQIPKTLQIGAKSVLGGEVLLDVSLENPESGEAAYLSKAFSQASAQNYRTFVAYENDEDETGTVVTDLAPYFAETDNGYQAYVYIANYGGDADQILSITDIKTTFASPASMSFGYSTDLVALFNEKLQADAPEQPAGEAQLISAAFTSDSIRYTKQAELKVETTADVEDIVVLKENGKEQSATVKSEINDAGNKVWTLKFKPGKAGVYNYTVYGLDAEGGQTGSAAVSIETTRR